VWVHGVNYNVNLGRPRFCLFALVMASSSLRQVAFVSICNHFCSTSLKHSLVFELSASITLTAAGVNPNRGPMSFHWVQYSVIVWPRSTISGLWWAAWWIIWTHICSCIYTPYTIIDSQLYTCSLSMLAQDAHVELCNPFSNIHACSCSGRVNSWGEGDNAGIESLGEQEVQPPGNCKQLRF